jgi:hypothetical protein
MVGGVAFGTLLLLASSADFVFIEVGCQTSSYDTEQIRIGLH